LCPCWSSNPPPSSCHFLQSCYFLAVW
jgi:hypothetical protein